MSILSLEPDGSREDEPCPCCGEPTRTVWGYLYADGDAHGVYFARWAAVHPERGLTLVVSLGGWGGGDATARQAVGLECRALAGGPGFMVVDAADTPWGGEALLGRMLSRAEALAGPARDEALAAAELIVGADARVREFLTVRSG